MENLKLACEAKVYASDQELEGKDKDLLDAAKEATKLAYAPYSNFHVGAALRLDDGTVIQGNNQENAAYPSGLCAERVALFHAGAAYPQKKVEAIAITAATEAYKVDEPIMPCGACLQVMAETEQRNQGQPIKVILGGQTGNVMVADGIHNFLPMQFVLKKLN